MSKFSEVTGYPEYHDLSDSELQEFGMDYAKGLLTGGITSGYASLHATARGDWDEVLYWTRVELAVLSTQWTVLQALNYIQGPKYAMTFHQAHSAMGPARGLFLRAVFSNPIVSSVSSAVAQAYVWSEIGDPMTGAMHYSGAGTMSGGTMPVITGGTGDSPFKFSSPSWTLQSWWESL